MGGDAADDINRDSPDLVADLVHFPVWILWGSKTGVVT